jgi:integration host factor subunit beta
MTKSKLIDALAAKQDHLPFPDVEEAVRKVIDRMSAALATGERIEIRGHAYPVVSGSPKG